jgi:HSP20 family molecular chaperone IbpA
MSNFKVFWVSHDDTRLGNKLWKKEPHDEVDDHGHDIEIDTNMHNERDHETDIGQIAVDILDCPDEIVIIAPIAWVDPSDIDIGLSRNILTLSGNRAQGKIYLDAKRMLIEECFYGAFSRSIILPENLGFDQIKANVDHNVIQIHIPKLTLISKSIKVGEK